MNNDKYHCPKCKLLFDSLNHLPRILNSCNHNLCSYCINEQLHNTPQKIICPIDNIIYDNISSINIFKENANLIEELQESLNIPSNHNYEISNDDICFDKSGIMNSDKFNDTINSFNLNVSIISSSHCYYKKAKNIRLNLGENNNLMCNIHSLPLNVICIDERKKICSQCALNDEHSNHQIITESEFMNNIENLIDLFQEVDNNQIKYLDFNNINTKSILDKIGNNIDELIKMINNTKNDIINNIKEQCDNVEKYLKERKKEIFDKYQSTSFDISTLRESTLNWMQIVTNKLDLLNEIKNPSIECIKLLDTEQNKSIFNLIRNGKQLNGRYNFIQEMVKVVDKLERFDKGGISIKPNKNIIDRIIIKDKEHEENLKDNNNENIKDDINIDINLNIDEIGKKNEVSNNNNQKTEKKEDKNIKSTLFKIEENNELINSLHLTKFKFDFIDKIINNDNNEIINKDDIQEKKLTENKNNNIDNKTENNKINITDNDTYYEHDLLLNLKINKFKKDKDINNDNNNCIKNNDNIINENKKNNNNISKMIDDLNLNDETLLINPLTTKDNEIIYHKKIKNDYYLNSKKLENSINQNINESQNEKKEIYNQITTKKIDISELNKNNKLLESKKDFQINNNKNKCNKKSHKNSFGIYNNGDNRSIGYNADVISYNSNNNKNEININFTKRFSGSKKYQPICSNYTKSAKKNVFMKQDSSEEISPFLMSRSPGRMIGKSKLDGFYNFIPPEKNNKKKIEVNQFKNKDKTLAAIHDYVSNKIYVDKHQYKTNKNINEENDMNIENTSNNNNNNTRRTSFCITKGIKKMKIITKEGFAGNKNPKKTNNAKIMNNSDDQDIYKAEEDKIINNQINIQNKLGNYNLVNSSNNIINNNNSYETKSKKELQEFINNQLKNNIPNFSRVNMSGYGTQYLCSYLHKNPNINYKEIKLLGCNLNDDDLFMLTRTLIDHDIGLLVLNLSSNKITDDSASNILDILKDCKSLKGLSLYNNIINNILKNKLKEYAKLGRENLDTVQLYI